jgi:hypothetical protein
MYWNGLKTRDFAGNSARLLKIYYKQAIILNPDLCKYQLSIEDFNEALYLKLDSTSTYYSCGLAYFRQDKDELGCRDARKACTLVDCTLLEQAKRDGYHP